SLRSPSASFAVCALHSFPTRRSSDLTGPVSVAFGPAATETAAAGVFTSPGGFYRFVVPEGWELWEEQASARGDAIEPWNGVQLRSEEHTSELQSRENLVCRLLLEKKK